jgi:putative ABC transport system permease protein
MTSFWRNLFRKTRRDEDLDAELLSYTESLAQEKMRQGLSCAEAHRAARLELGGIEQVKEEVREVRAGAWLDCLLQDLRYGARTLRKNPAFTAIAVLTLALGIGANTAMFTLADATLLRPLPYRAANQLVWITEQSSTGDSTGVSWPNFGDWKRMNTAFSEMAGYRGARLAFSSDGEPSIVLARYVTANYFNVVGGQAVLGRTFVPEENVVGGPEVAILSYEFWQQQFGGSPQIVGRTIRLEGRSFTIVGVMPKDFGAVTQTAVWAPFEQNVPKLYLDSRQYAWLLYIVARRKPGVSPEAARADMDRVGQLLAKQYPAIDGFSRPLLQDLRQNMLGDNREILILLVTAVVLLLAITCANVAGLLLVRMVSRQRELALRRALGASKHRILQKILTEGLLLALAGGILGAFTAWALVQFAAISLPKTLPLVAPLSVNTRALLFTLFATILSSFAFGIAPALLGTRANPQSVLQSSSYRVRGGYHRVHAALIICEIGLAMGVLVGAGLLVRTMAVLLRTNVGFDSGRLLTATVTLPQTDYPKGARSAQFAEQSLERLQRLPGVESAAAVFPIPFTQQVYEVWLAVEGRVPRPDFEQTTYVSVVSSNYFDTMKIPILKGRGFVKADEAPNSHSLLIDRGLAELYWPDQDPVGKSVKLATQDFSNPEEEPWKIIGVVEPVHGSGLDAKPELRTYALIEQMPSTSFSFVVRAKTNPLGFAREVQDEIHSVDRNVPVFNVGTMDGSIYASQAPRRLAMLVLISFSLAALCLAMMGLYGLMSFIVGQRTSEIGIRMALGANSRDVLKMILHYGAALGIAGILSGFAAALSLARLMRTLLYGMDTFDAPTFAVSTMVIAMIVLAACYFPARRAMRVDPMVALRYE